MNWYLLIGFVVGAMTATIGCVIVGQRLLRTTQAEKAEQLLDSGNRIAGITLPEVHDPRWVVGEAEFIAFGKKVTGKILHIGQHLFVELDGGAVYVGAGQALPGGPAYGKRVIQAYRQRLADEARKGSQ